MMIFYLTFMVLTKIHYSISLERYVMNRVHELVRIRYSRPGKIDTGKIDTFCEISRNFKKFRVGCSKNLRPYLILWPIYEWVINQFTVLTTVVMKVIFYHYRDIFILSKGHTLWLIAFRASDRKIWERLQVGDHALLKWWPIIGGICWLCIRKLAVLNLKS